MLKEIEYELDGNTYLLKQLEIEESQEVLVRLLRLLGDNEGISLESLPSRLQVKDINFLREHLFGANCQLLDENSGNWVPLGKAVVKNHFAGHLGKMFHLLGKALMLNYSDFLADLRLESLVGESAAGSSLLTSIGSSGE